MGDIKLTRAPISLNVGKLENTLPKRRKRGVPGGWGTPRVTEQAINSPQSQNEVVGAIVIKYKISGIKNDKNAKIILIFLYIFYPILINSNICL